MKIDWPLLVSIVIPLLTLFLGAVLNRLVERRAKLTTYLGHASVFELHPNNGPAELIHTHAIVITNVGGKAASNVRLTHNHLPDFHIWPALPHTVEDIPGGSRDIVIPVLVPGQQITVSYMYFPPITWNLINGPVRSDEGLAKVLNMLPVRQFSKPVRFFIGYLMLAGTIATLYILIVISIKVITRF